MAISKKETAQNAAKNTNKEEATTQITYRQMIREINAIVSDWRSRGASLETMLAALYIAKENIGIQYAEEIKTKFRIKNGISD